jgi:hypothetical protein
MLLLLIANLDLAETGFTFLPEVEHEYDPYKSYPVVRSIITDPKDPNDEVDYQVDWTHLLGADSIATSQWNIPDGLTGVSMSKTMTTTTVFVNGGTSGEDYTIINRVVTGDGRTFERYVIVPVREQ